LKSLVAYRIATDVVCVGMVSAFAWMDGKVSNVPRVTVRMRAMVMAHALVERAYANKDSWASTVGKTWRVTAQCTALAMDGVSPVLRQRKLRI